MTRPAAPPRGGRILGAAVAALLLAGSAAVSRGAAEPPAVQVLPAETVPVVRPKGVTALPSPAEKPGTGPRPAAPASQWMPLLSLWRAESAYRDGQSAEALSLFLDLAYNSPDGERKGYVWMRVGDLLLGRRELKPALDAADKAIFLSRARFLVLSALELKYRIYRGMGRNAEASEIAASLLHQGYVQAEPAELLAMMAKTDAAGGNVSRSLNGFRMAIAAARTPEEAAGLRQERERVIEGLSSIPLLREAAEAEQDPDVRSHLYLILGRIAARKGYNGMGAYALELSARIGGAWGEEAARQLSRLEQIVASRPKIVGILPLTGRHADIGFAVLSGAEAALQQSRGTASDLFWPVLRWRDTAGQPDQAREEYLAASRDVTVVGFLGPLTGEEGFSVSTAFGLGSPPALYLGQKQIPEVPYLYRFGLTPIQEARAVLDHFFRGEVRDLILFHPENGYGFGFAEAVREAAKEKGIVLARTVSYRPDTNDFTDAIREAVGRKAFEEHSKTREKGKAIELPVGAIVIADRWDKMFLLSSQLRFYNVYHPLAGFSGGVGGELLRRGGEAVNGAVFSIDYSDAVPGDAGERFRKGFREGMGYPPSRFEAIGFDGANLLAEAYRLESWKEESRSAGEAVREWLPTIRTFRGITGLFRFGPAGDIYRDLSLMRVESGRLVPVGP